MPSGMRWIVDFKLSRHEGADADAFLDREQERYRAQLETYARVMRRDRSAADSRRTVFPAGGRLARMESGVDGSVAPAPEDQRWTATPSAR